jgi:hypothetical protein
MATFTLWLEAQSLLTFSVVSWGQVDPLSRRFQSAQAGAGRGWGYLLQSLCSMLYTSSSRLRPSKKGMRSSSSVSVMSSNQDCTGTWKTWRRQQNCTQELCCSYYDWVPRLWSFLLVKRTGMSWTWWHTPIIPATPEVEVGGSWVWGQPRKS